MLREGVDPPAEPALARALELAAITRAKHAMAELVDVLKQCASDPGLRLPPGGIEVFARSRAAMADLKRLSVREDVQWD